MPQAERRAQQLIAASFVLLAVYIGIEVLHGVIGSHHSPGDLQSGSSGV